MSVLLTALLALAPALLLLGLVLLGCFPGERAIAAAVARAWRRRRPGRSSGRSGRNGTDLPRGGRLIAASLAGRGPPAPQPA